MPKLLPEWAAHLESGVSHRLGSSHADGRPEICRALAAQALPDGRIELVLDGHTGRDLLAAVRTSGRIAYVSSQPDSNRTLHVKGVDAEPSAVLPAHLELMTRSRDRFVRRVEPFGFTHEAIHGFWFDVGPEQLVGLRFTPCGAWDQSPGPGAGQVVDLLPVGASGGSQALTPEPSKGEVVPARTPGLPQAPMPRPAAARPTLHAVRRLLEGVIPPAMCSVAADGMPHVSYLSHAEYVDVQHVALTYQFFNRTRANVLATGRTALMVEDPATGVGVVLQLRYLRTETEGPVFQRLRVKLAGIAAHTGMESVFHLRGADLYRVESLQQMDPAGDLAAIAPRCDLALGVRRLSEELAEAADLRGLLQRFTEGLPRELKISHAIVWMQDESQQNLYTLASCGYEQAGSGAELPLAELGLVGVALRENVPIRIGHMSAMLSYGLSWRYQLEQLGLQAAQRHGIALPGLVKPRSQLAVPLRARGRSVGVLLVESEHDQFFSYDDEDALSAIGAQLAQGIAALHAVELSEPVPLTAPTRPALEPRSAQDAGRAPLRLRHYVRDHSVFVNDEYLIKGVAGAIVAKLVRDQITSGRDGFSTRELRLAGDDLRLPEVQDNLGVRLLMLERRLAERDVGLRIERCGRGQYRLVARGPLEIESDATAPP